MTIDLEEVRNVSIFEGISPQDLELLLEDSRERELEAEEVLFEQDDPSDPCFYVVVEGSIGIMKLMRTEQQEVSTMKAGDYFGEFGMITGDRRLAGAVARESTRLLEIPRDALEQLKSKNPPVLISLYENMFRELRKRFKTLASKAEKTQFWLS